MDDSKDSVSNLELPAQEGINSVPTPTGDSSALSTTTCINSQQDSNALTSTTTELCKNDLVEKVTSLEADLESSRKNLNRMQRLYERSMKYNEDLREQVKHLSSELHDIRTGNNKSDAAVQVDIDLLSSTQAEHAAAKVDYGITSSQNLPDLENDATIKTAECNALDDLQQSHTDNSILTDTTAGTTTEQVESMSIADSLKAAAEEAVQLSGFVYDSQSSMYYDYNSGYYYDAERGLYYDSSNGTYIFYDEQTRSYKVHSQVDVKLLSAYYESVNLSQQQQQQWRNNRSKAARSKSPTNNPLVKTYRPNRNEVDERGATGSADVGRSSGRLNRSKRFDLSDDRRDDRKRYKSSRKQRRRHHSRSEDDDDDSDDGRKKKKKKKKHKKERRSRSSRHRDESVDAKRDRNDLVERIIRDDRQKRKRKDKIHDVNEEEAIVDKIEDLEEGELSDNDTAAADSNKKGVGRRDDEKGDHPTAMDVDDDDLQGNEKDEKDDGHDSDSSMSSSSSSSDWLSSSYSESENGDTGGCSAQIDCALDEEYATNAWKPCIRLMVRESEYLQMGSLHLVTCTGGTIGREPDQNHIIVIPDPLVSKAHAELLFDEDLNVYTITDFASQNGIYINDTRIGCLKTKSNPHPLSHGDVLKLGSTQFDVHIHPGTETCADCEPGQVMAKLKDMKDSNEERAANLNREVLRRKQLKQIKKKFGLENMAYADNPNAINTKDYNDKAAERRNTVGSDNPYQKSEAPASVHKAISQTNKGHKMLQKLGWKEGESLGKSQTGISEPVQVNMRVNQQAGLGSSHSQAISLDNVGSGQSTRKMQQWSKARERFDRINSEQTTSDPTTNDDNWISGGTVQDDITTK